MTTFHLSVLGPTTLLRSMYVIYLLELIVFISTTSSYKFLIYNPFLGHSHVSFMGNIADVLSEGGHDVTVVMPEMDEEQLHRTGVKVTKKIMRTPGDPRARQMLKEGKQGQFRKIWTMASSPFTMLQMAKNLSSILEWQCETLINDDDLLRKLREENFDVGISEAYYVCGLGLFEALNIKTTIATVSNPHLDAVAYAIGEPAFPSYVPGSLSTTGDKMTFTERLQNVIALVIGRGVVDYLNNREIAVFRKKYKSFKDYTELIAQASFVFTNGNPYLDFPHPTLYKTVMIGGFAVSRSANEKHTLSKEWNALLNARRRTVLVSFGSVAKSVDMPENFKRTLLDVFASMPEVTFIWKYEDPSSKFAESLPNVYLSAWVPQILLLEDERLSAFLTHGGMGSSNELAMMGKPAIVIPIFGDQMRNSHMLARHGGALVLEKSDLSNFKKLKSAFEELLNNPSYARNAVRLSQMLRSQPISPQELVLRHAEFAARFGKLANLDPYGRHLSVVQYYLLDVVAILVATLLLIVFIVIILVRKCFYCRNLKLKLE